jgi:hypothetical protein
MLMKFRLQLWRPRPLVLNQRIRRQLRSPIFSTMIGAIDIARIPPDHAMREKVLAGTRDFLLRSF